MSDSKKSSDEESIIVKIFSSIDKIGKIDLDESKDEKNEDNKNNKENNKEKSKKNFDSELPLTLKANEFLSDDFKRKFPILAIIGTAIGIILIIFGIIFMLSASERVVDSVSSGETGTIAIFIIFLGILFLGISLLKIFAKTGTISNALDNLDDLTLLDEAEFDNEKSVEIEQLNKENAKLDESHDSKENLDLYKMTKLDELEDSEKDLAELEEGSKEDLEDSLKLEEGSKEDLEDSLKLEEVGEIYKEKIEANSKPNYKYVDSNKSNEDK